VGGHLVTGVNSVTKGNKLPGQCYPSEIQFLGANFLGPGTRRDLRLNANITPDRPDEAAYRHNMVYDYFKDTATRNKADIEIHSSPKFRDGDRVRVNQKKGTFVRFTDQDGLRKLSASLKLTHSSIHVQSI